MFFYVYILRSLSSGRYYIGSTEDLQRRLEEHNRGAVDSTRSKGPWEIVYTETYETRLAATQREQEIKSKKSRRWIEYHLLRTEDSGS